jgi:hypothetical protein
MEAVLNGFSFALLLTSLFVLRFRGWNRPGMVAAYFLFFLVLEVVASHYLLPPGAFGPGLGYVCLGLTPPVLMAAYFVWRHERAHGESGDE